MLASAAGGRAGRGRFDVPLLPPGNCSHRGGGEAGWGHQESFRILLCGRASSEDKEFRALEGMSHQLLQDKADATDEVLEIISNWIFSRSLQFDF